MHRLTGKKNKIIIYLIFLFILSTTSNKSLEFHQNYSAKINKIQVLGLSNNINSQIRNKIEKLLNINIFFIDRNKIKKIISEYNLVEIYSVKKIYPKKIEVKIEQTKFIAKISGSKQVLIGSNGKLIKREINEKLPFLFGKLNSKNFLEFKKTIDNSAFKFNDLKSVSFYPSKRWDITTNENILINLPKDNLLQSLNFAYKLIIDNNFKEIRIIDLRVKNHVVIK
jgi:cell division protein FtsQ